MIPVPNLELVLIIPEALDTREDKKVIMSEIEKDNAKKLQNRGTIFAVGDNVEFWQKGDFVSFYRNAATEIKEGDDVYFSINQGNILCKFVTNGKK